jgi:NADPH-dependent 2,4-dienoyl-CoA reductase/sulfur reductase-like enzyme
MKSTRYLLIGGGLAAGQAVKGVREEDADGGIILINKEPYLPYNRPPLSKKLVRGEKTKDEIFVESEAFYDEQGVDRVLETTVELLNLENKTATLSNGEVITFEKALLATGGTPIKLDIPGSDLPEVYTLRTIDNSLTIREAAETHKRAVIIGAGFIGMELAASLTELGVDVTVIEMMPQLWPRFTDEALAGFFQDYFTERGITFYLDETVEEILGAEHVEGVKIASGEEITADFVCIAVGIRPNVALAEAAGLDIDDGIIVNEYLQASHPDVYAVGDIANYPDPYFDKRRRVEHWGQAEYTGALAGRNMAGAEQPYELLTYVWSELFDLHLEFGGDETEADEMLQRGAFEDGSFARFFLKDGRMTAFFAVNPEDGTLSEWNRLIAEQVDLSDRKKALTDPEFDPAEL